MTFFSFCNSCSFSDQVVEMGKLKIRDQEKSLILNEITLLAKENEKDIKMWEERYAKSTASHEDEVKKLHYGLAGK